MRYIFFRLSSNNCYSNIISVTLDEDETSKTLRSRIRIASINFVKETLVGLPGIPTEDELQKLQVERKNEASKRIQQEQKAAATAKLKYEQDIAKRSTKLSAVTGSSSFGVNSNRTSPQGKPFYNRPVNVWRQHIWLKLVSNMAPPYASRLST